MFFSIANTKMQSQNLRSTVGKKIFNRFLQAAILDAECWTKKPIALGLEDL